jgi:hypothetical protein
VLASSLLEAFVAVSDLVREIANLFIIVGLGLSLLRGQLWFVCARIAIRSWLARGEHGEGRYRDQDSHTSNPSNSPALQAAVAIMAEGTSPLISMTTWSPPVRWTA